MERAPAGFHLCKLIGIGTVRASDMQLTHARLRGTERHPLRVGRQLREVVLTRERYATHSSVCDPPVRYGAGRGCQEDHIAALGSRRS